MIVLGVSAAIAGLLNDGAARRILGEEQLHTLHLIDSEVASALRRQCAAGRINEKQAVAVLDVWRRLGVVRYPAHGLLDRIWELRENLSAYDAGYVALAEGLDCPLVTIDARLAASPGMRCPVTLLPA